MKKNTVLILLLLTNLMHAFAQQTGGYLYGSLGPHLSFTQNVGAQYGYGKPAKIGVGYSGQVGYGYKFRSGLFSELGIGYYNFRQSVDAAQLHMFLPSDTLSYSDDYLQAVLKFGYSISFPKSKVNLQPFVGTRFMFYLPSEEKAYGEWNNVNLSLFESNDIRAARWKYYPTDYAFWAFILHTGLKADWPISSRLRVSTTLFWDLGFKALRAEGYHSEELYHYNYDYFYSATAANKGDAIGLNFGLSYKLK